MMIDLFADIGGKKAPEKSPPPSPPHKPKSLNKPSTAFVAQAHDEGWMAYLNGIPSGLNPYNRPTIHKSLAESWMTGWEGSEARAKTGRKLK